MDGIVTLAERQRRKLDAMQASVVSLDAAPSAYARRDGGRFIRFGSSAKGQLRVSSDIDLIADFPTHRLNIEACDVADDLCVQRDLVPDSRPVDWCSARLLDRDLAEARSCDERSALG